MHPRLPTFRWFFFLALLCISLFLTLQMHRNTGRFNWQSEIFADGAGYYAYLPVTFLYRFDYNKFPAGIDDSTGCGFVDHAQKKFVYKYTCGVAMMLAPFFAATVLISEIAGLPLEGGFSVAFHRMADIAGVFYLVIGLFFLGEVLKRYVSGPVRYIVLLLIYAGTNLFFYALRQPLMSHVYSFCVISIFIYAFHVYLERGTWRTFILVALSASLAILVRPVNGIILFLLLFWNVSSFRALNDRLRLLLSWRNIVSFLVVLLIVLLPQMLYWFYMFGQPVHYSYEGETFSNWTAPRLAEVWFAPLNGLFLYNPLWLVFISGIVLMIILREKNGILLLSFFLLVSYIISAWHSWFFGCGYGHRAFIDFIPVFAIPFGVITDRIFRIRTRIPAALMIILMVAMSYYNLRIIYSYSGCFFGSVWDWERYQRQLRAAGLYKHQGPSYVFINDFENGGISRNSYRDDSVSRSYNVSVRLDNKYRKGCRSSLDFYAFALPFPTHAEARIYVYAPSGTTSGAQMVCWIERKGQIVFQDSCAIDPFISRAGEWSRVFKTFTFAPAMPWDAVISVELRNPGGARFFADDMKVVYY
jgi:hypothetical protein